MVPPKTRCMDHRREVYMELSRVEVAERKSWLYDLPPHGVAILRSGYVFGSLPFRSPALRLARSVASLTRKDSHYFHAPPPYGSFTYFVICGEIDWHFLSLIKPSLCK